MKMSDNHHVTRSYGLLEGFLAKRRACLAGRLIPDGHRRGRILDIGCGIHPYHLINTGFFEKYGIDKTIREKDYESLKDDNIFIRTFNIEDGGNLPFEDEHFDVITMLAVLEHVEPSHVSRILNDVFRVLKNDGIFILSTPPPWTDRLLLIMAGLGLVSVTEIKDHKDTYRSEKIIFLLREAGFQREKIRYGYFEMFMNIWVAARKAGAPIIQSSE
jgi:2-polyprenyl-3-methyl-5-hydroxy-6-metoxy-1,4-benzoquinol methylase